MKNLLSKFVITTAIMLLYSCSGGETTDDNETIENPTQFLIICTWPSKLPTRSET